MGLLTLAAATHSAMFAAPFALIGAGFGEWQRIGSWMYYVLVAIVIAAIGFLAQYWAEAQGEASIVNNYAATRLPAHGLRRRARLLAVCGPLCARRRDREPEIIPLRTPKPAALARWRRRPRRWPRES